MTATDTTPVMPATAPEPLESTAGRCPACVHQEEAHDVIATRFCAATTERSLDRGCACRS